MHRKRKDDRQVWSHRVYQYKVTLQEQSAPAQWPDALRAVVFAQRDLWNACQAAWERNRTQYEALMAQGDTLMPLREARDQTLAQVIEAERHIKEHRQAARTRTYPGAEQDHHALVAARGHLQQAKDTLRRAESAYRDHIRPHLTALLATLWQEVHALGQGAPLPWYNERQVTEAFRHTVERFLKHLGGPPRPKRRLEQAHLTYRFTGPPLTWEQLLEDKTSMIWFDPVERWARAGQRPNAFTMGHLRITDTDTVTFGVWLHRRPPDGALIKGVDLVGRERARGWGAHQPRWTWTFSVLCEIPPRDQGPECAQAPPMGEPSAALDLNWRILDDGRIRVGMVFDGQTHTPLYFPSHLVQRWRFAQGLQRDIAAALERCKATLGDLWQEHPLPPDLDPRGAGWVQTGQGGLVRLRTQVEALPPTVPSRQPTLTVLTAWATRTGKLWYEWRALTGHLERAKAAWYAATAQQLCRQYRQLAVEALDLKRMAAQADLAPRLARSQKYRQLVGLGAFLQRLAHTAQREGVQMRKIDPADTTRTCPWCGTILTKEQFEAQQGAQFVSCPHGCRYDMDIGAAIALYRRAFPATAALGARC
jgi:Putative transposase DNA-binding domain